MYKSGLILEGGAMRGMFTAGVLDVFIEKDITFDGTVGVSAGATFGCNIKSGQAGRTLRYNMRFAKDTRYGSLRSLITTGDYYNEDFCYRRVPDELDPFDQKAFEENPMAFYVVATRVDTGRPAYRRLTDCGRRDLQWIQASASMPVFANPVEIDGHAYLDGGISDSIPLRFMEHLGYNKNVVVLTRPDGYRKSTSRLQPLMDRLLDDYPAISKAMRRRPAVYNRTLDYIREKEAAGEIFVIRQPMALPVGRLEHDPKKMKAAWEIGVNTARDCLPELQNFLQP